MRKMMILLVTFILLLSCNAFASTTKEIEFKRSKTVYITSEEEMLRYPKDMNTRYIFIMRPIMRATTRCPSCGKAAKYYISSVQVRGYTHGCFNNPLSPDYVSVYARYRDIDCGCGYYGSQFIDNSYTVYCIDTGITWTASYSTTVAMGYDVHQDMSKWG